VWPGRRGRLTAGSGDAQLTRAANRHVLGALLLGAVAAGALPTPAVPRPGSHFDVHVVARYRPGIVRCYERSALHQPVLVGPDGTPRGVAHTSFTSIRPTWVLTAGSFKNYC
jgi:hypothetical protein